MWEDILYIYIYSEVCQKQYSSLANYFQSCMRYVYGQNIKPAIQNALKEHKYISKSLGIKQTIKTFTSHVAFSIATHFQNITYQLHDNYKQWSLEIITCSPCSFKYENMSLYRSPGISHSSKLHRRSAHPNKLECIFPHHYFCNLQSKSQSLSQCCFIHVTV